MRIPHTNTYGDAVEALTSEHAQRHPLWRSEWEDAAYYLREIANYNAPKREDDERPC